MQVNSFTEVNSKIWINFQGIVFHFCSFAKNTQK